MSPRDRFDHWFPIACGLLMFGIMVFEGVSVLLIGFGVYS